MNGEDEQRKLRRKQWETLMKKYEKRAKLNKAECKFSEVNYTLFAESVWDSEYKKHKGNKKKQSVKHVDFGKTGSIEKTIKKYPKNKVSFTSESQDSGITEGTGDTRNFSNDQITFNSNWDCNRDATEIIDSGSDDSEKNGIETSDYFTDMVTNTDSQTEDTPVDSDESENLNSELRKLIQFVEITLQSKLKELMLNRSVCKLLETKSMPYWHARVKHEMKMLENYISVDNLKQYMRYCFECNNAKRTDLKVIDHIIVNELNSNLKHLLLKREFAQGNENLYLKYCKRIRREWKKLSEEFPADILLTYGSNILLSIKKLKSG